MPLLLIHPPLPRVGKFQGTSVYYFKGQSRTGRWKRVSIIVVILRLCGTTCWSRVIIASFVKFLTPTSGLQGYWDPYPIDMEFRPPCMVLSTIGISKPGKLEGKSTQQCSTHLHQLHICLPSSRSKTRLLYRMSLDFAPWIKHIPFMHLLWSHFAEKASLKFCSS
jgi:hypothetical protein